MNPFRVSIWELMGGVLLVALDLAVSRAPMSGRPVTETLLVMGVLPMGNFLLVAGWLLARGFVANGCCRPVLLGFEVAGAVSLLLFTAAAVHDPLRLLEGARLTLLALQVPGGPTPLAASLALFALQFASALVGGWVGGRLESKFLSRRAFVGHSIKA